MTDEERQARIKSMAKEVAKTWADRFDIDFKSAADKALAKRKLRLEKKKAEQAGE